MATSGPVRAGGRQDCSSTSISFALASLWIERATFLGY